MTRTYGEDEARLIFERAAATQPQLPATRAEGLTLAELQEIGREVGIDAVAIARAATAIDTQVAAPPVPVLGSPVVAQYEEWLARRLSPGDRDEALLAVRRRMGRHGVVEERGHGFDWRARDFMGGRYITVETRDDRTLVRALGNFRDGAVAWFTMVGATTGMGSLFVLKATGLLTALGLGAAPIVAAAAYVPARLFWKWRYKSEDALLRGAMADVVRTLDAPED